jgi:hypothetical protein
VAFVAVPLSAAWLLNALWLGRKQEAMAVKDVESSQARVVAK